MSDTLPDAHVSPIRTVRVNLDPHRMYTVVDPTRTVTDLTCKINTHGMTTLELDSHANTCVLGRDCHVILDYERPVQVDGYDPALRAKTYSTISRVVSHNNPATGEVIHLVINRAIHIPHLDHHLLCPMQC